MKKVIITGYHLTYKIGQTVELSEHKADSLIKANVAKLVDSSEVVKDFKDEKLSNKKVK